MATAPRDLLPNPGSSVIYRAASPLERSMADADCERLLAIDAEEIISVWDPWQISASNLPYLAWAMGALIWEENWQVHTQREWTAVQWLWKSLRGKEAGIRMALDFAGRDSVELGSPMTGYDLIEAVVPPQGFFASTELTKAEHDAWIHQMPELRLKLTEGIGQAYLDEFFTEANVPGLPNMGFADSGFVAEDDGWVLHGRRIILRQNGVDVALQNTRRETVTVEGHAVDVERVSLPGLAPIAFCEGDFEGDDKFVCATTVEARLIMLRLEADYDHVSSLLGLDTVLPDSLEVQDPRYERDSDIRPSGPFFFADDGMATQNSSTFWPLPLAPPSPDLDDNFIERDRGGDMLADRIFLIDPAVISPLTAGLSVVGDRIGMSPYHAELLVDLRTAEKATSWICDQTILDDDISGFAISEDGSHIDRALRAVVAAKALRDSVSVSFEPTRPLEAWDYITEQSTAADMVRNVL